MNSQQGPRSVTICLWLMILLLLGSGAGAESAGSEAAEADMPKGAAMDVEATEEDAASSNDPLEYSFNRPSYNFNDALDRAILKPIAKGYVAITPQLLRTGITNVYENFAYLNVILNDILQGKVDQTGSDIARFVFNTTMGIGGIVDVGTAVGLPRHEEDFGQTLAKWGSGEGDYLVIPFLGPSTARDVPDYGTSLLTNPLFYFSIANAILIPVAAVGIINKRANFLDATRLRDQAAIDPYTFTREAYRQRRTFLIYDGHPPAEDYDIEKFMDDELELEDEEFDDILLIE